MWRRDLCKQQLDMLMRKLKSFKQKLVNRFVASRDCRLLDVVALCVLTQVRPCVLDACFCTHVETCVRVMSVQTGTF